MGALAFVVLYLYSMSTSVPDGISFADLQALAKDAPEDSAIVPTEGPFNGLMRNSSKTLLMLS